MSNCLHPRVEKHPCNLVIYADDDITCLDCYEWLFCPCVNEVKWNEREEKEKRGKRDDRR
jgi:hypothetical protein